MSSPNWLQTVGGRKIGPYVDVVLKVIAEPKEKDRTFRLDGETQYIKVGRASNRNHPYETVQDDNCIIDSPIVSRRHAHFVIGEKSQPLWLVDDGSTHGTFIDEVKLSPGIKTPVENGAIIRFGEKVINGTRMYGLNDRVVANTETVNYDPSMFQISLAWHPIIIGEPYRPAWPKRTIGIQAPTPASDSEDGDDTSDVETPLPATGSQPADVIGSSNYIDLTDDPEVEEVDEHIDGDGDVQIIEKEHKPMTLDLTQDIDEVMDHAIKDVNVITDPAKRSYRFIYHDSDPEEEAELTTPSSPNRAYDSLYDNTDESDVPSSPMHSSDEPMEEEQDDEDLQDQPQNDDELEVCGQDHSSNHSEADSPGLEHTDNLPKSLFEPTTTIFYPEMIHTKTDTSVAAVEANYGTPFTEDDRNTPPLPDYEEALEWLGLDGKYTAYQVVDMAESKIAADPDDEGPALECVQAIADDTADEGIAWELTRYLENGDMPKKVELEIEGEYEADANSWLGLPPPMISSDVQSSPVVIDATGPQVDHTYSYPRLTASLNRAAFSDVFVEPQSEPSRIPDSFNTASNPTSFYGPPSGDATSSSIMRISNLVEAKSTAKAQDLPEPPAKSIADAWLSFDMPSEKEATQFLVSSTKPDAEDLETTIVAEQQDNSIGQEQREPTPDTVHTGQKRKLDFTDFEQEEDTPTSNPVSSESAVSMPLSESLLQDAQVLSQQPIDQNDSAEVHTLSQTSITKTNTERDLPPKPKRRHIMSRQRPGFVKTLVTHFAAGALGAFGVVAAIVATTPLSLQEELLFRNS